MSTKPAIIANDLMDSRVRRIHKLEERCERLTAEVEMMLPVIDAACDYYNTLNHPSDDSLLLKAIEVYTEAKEAQRDSS